MGRTLIYNFFRITVWWYFIGVHVTRTGNQGRVCTPAIKRRYRLTLVGVAPETKRMVRTTSAESSIIKLQKTQKKQFVIVITLFPSCDFLPMWKRIACVMDFLVVIITIYNHLSIASNWSVLLYFYMYLKII